MVHMVWYGMVWYGMVWYGMVWYGSLPRSDGLPRQIWDKNAIFEILAFNIRCVTKLSYFVGVDILTGGVFLKLFQFYFLLFCDA